MKNKNFIFFSSFLIIFIIFISLFLYFQNQESFGLYDNFAKCLKEKGFVMYGSASCSWCQKEKANFGSSFKFVPYVECTLEPKKCVENKIEATPTWVLPNGQRLIGYQGLEKLAQISGCPLP